MKDFDDQTQRRLQAEHTMDDNKNKYESQALQQANTIDRLN
jgi:hypothetical protein